MSEPPTYQYRVTIELGGVFQVTLEQNEPPTWLWWVCGCVIVELAAVLSTLQYFAAGSLIVVCDEAIDVEEFKVSLRTKLQERASKIPDSVRTQVSEIAFPKIEIIKIEQKPAPRLPYDNVKEVLEFVESVDKLKVPECLRKLGCFLHLVATAPAVPIPEGSFTSLYTTEGRDHIHIDLRWNKARKEKVHVNTQFSF